MAFFAIFVPFVANTTVLDRQWSAGLREVLHSVYAIIPSISTRRAPCSLSHSTFLVSLSTASSLILYSAYGYT